MCIAHVSTVGVLEAKNKYQSWTGVTLSSCMGVSVPHLAPLKASLMWTTISIVAELLFTTLKVHLQ